MSTNYLLSTRTRLIIGEKNVHEQNTNFSGVFISFGLLTAITLRQSRRQKPGGYPSRPITIIMCYEKSWWIGAGDNGDEGPMSKIMGVKVNMISKPGGAVRTVCRIISRPQQTAILF